MSSFPTSRPPAARPGVLLQPPRGRRHRRGSALIMALWALLLLSAAIFAWLKLINQSIAISNEASNGLDAKALAHSGIAAGLNGNVTRQTPILSQRFSATRDYRVQMTGENGRLNLNWIFQNPQTPDLSRIALFQRYLARRGLNIEQQKILSDCILDWLDPDNIPRLNGAEDQGDYHPPNRGFFLSVEELAQVKGSKPLTSQAGWEDDFTVVPLTQGAGLIDLQSASLTILSILPNVGDARAARFVKFRQGPDGLDGTADDHVFKDFATAASYLGLSSNQITQLQSFAYVEYPTVTVRLISTGHSGGLYRKVEVIARKDPQGNNPVIYSWKEL